MNNVSTISAEHTHAASEKKLFLQEVGDIIISKSELVDLDIADLFSNRFHRWPNFREFFPIEATSQTKEIIDQVVFRRFVLKEKAFNSIVLCEFKNSWNGDGKIGTAIHELFCLVKRQENGRQGSLSVHETGTVGLSVFHVPDMNAGQLRLVNVYFENRKWNFGAGDLSYTGQWPQGTTFFFKK